MAVYVANPLYDTVFKYLMEDERVARTILSALLKKKVVGVKSRRHEYSNVNNPGTVALYRIDFAATVEEDDGQQHLILIELQKTWLPTETLRFRRYLALQYNNEENMVGEGRDSRALPMVAIYLLGHRVGDVAEPVVYVNHNAYDYDGKEVKSGMPDPFVESLQHDSIIVQIPLLHGKVNNRLERVLSVFDQGNVEDGRKVVRLDERQFEGDSDMERIVHRLQSAAANPDMRYRMNVEDEYFRELESRDTALMEQQKSLMEQKKSLMEQKKSLMEKDKTLKEQEKSLMEKDKSLMEKDKSLKEKDKSLKEQDMVIKAQEESIRSAALAMHENGMQVGAIAKILNKSPEDIASYL